LPDAQGKVDLRALLRHLAREKHCNEVLAETGATLGGVFMQAGLVDELLVYIAPTLLGSDARPLLQLPEIRTLAEGIRLEFVEVAGVGKDCRMRLRVLPR
jgi:diaminohydroxyphosphoribosylaminopyrimidine deaminase/5-amino-6-(5-phosphoribosylamino)uracil reductase